MHIFDGFVPGDQPLIAGLIRLAFHDCAGFKSTNLGSSSSSDSASSSSSSSSSSSFSSPSDSDRDNESQDSTSASDESDDHDIVYICDGCIDLDEADHAGLYEGAIQPIEYICEMFAQDGLSRADCWSLAATIAIEQAANNTLNDIPYYTLVEKIVQHHQISVNLTR